MGSVSGLEASAQECLAPVLKVTEQVPGKKGSYSEARPHAPPYAFPLCASSCLRPMPSHKQC